MSSLRYNFRSRRDNSKSLDRDPNTIESEETPRPTPRRGRPPTRESAGKRVSKSASSSRDRSRLSAEERDRQLSALRDGWLNLNQGTTPIRWFPPHIAESANLLSPLGGRTPPPQNVSAAVEIQPKPSGIPDSSPDIKSEPLTSPQARSSTPVTQPTAPCQSARLSSKRLASLAPISFPSLDLSNIPGTEDLNLQLDPSTEIGTITYQEVVDFAKSQLNPEGTPLQQSPSTHSEAAVTKHSSNQKEVLLSVTGRSEGSTLTNEELLTGPSTNAQLILQLPSKTGETQPKSIYLGENSETQALTEHFLRTSHSPSGSSGTISLPSEARPKNQGDFSRTEQSGLLDIRSIGSTQTTQGDPIESVVTPRSSVTGSPPKTQEEYGQRFSVYSRSSQITSERSQEKLPISLFSPDYLHQQIIKARQEGEQRLREELGLIQEEFDKQLKEKEASLRNKFKERCKQLELEQIEQEVTFETQLNKETEERKRAIAEGNQRELENFIQDKQAHIQTIKNDFTQQQLQLEKGLEAIQTSRVRLEKDEPVLQNRIAELHKDQEEIDTRVKAQLKEDHKLRKRAVFKDFEKKVTDYEEELDRKFEEEQENLRGEYKQYAQSESKRLLKERDQQIKEFSDRIAEQKKAYTTSLEKKLEEYRKA